MLATFIDWYQAHPDDRRDPALANLQLADIVEGLKQQLPAFWRGDWPFDQPVEGGDPLAWWNNLRFHPHGRVMAVSSSSHTDLALLSYTMSLVPRNQAILYARQLHARRAH